MENEMRALEISQSGASSHQPPTREGISGIKSSFFQDGRWILIRAGPPSNNPFHEMATPVLL
jgi:hypothetical protein